MSGCKTVYKKSLFLFSLLIILLINAFLPQHLMLISHARDYDHNIVWNVLESQYCSIIFPIKIFDNSSAQYKQIATHIAQIVDQICPPIALQFGESSPLNKKFTIILEDFSDSTYGFATTIPHPLIRINLTAPGFNIFDTKFDSWLKILIAHEYTHLAHFDMTDKFTTFLRLFLGQIITPNALQPLWSIEGLAIYNESKYTTGGRLDDSRYEMYLRTDFLEDRLKSLEQIEEGYLISWPGGNAPYIYGQSLIHFINNEYGEEKLIEISKHFSSFPLLGMNWSLKKVLGIDIEELFQKWKNEKKKHFELQIEQITNYNNITESQQITKHHYWVANPLWLQQDKENQNPLLIYKVSTPRLYPSIRKHDFNTNTESILIKRTWGHGSSYSLSPDNQYLLYSKLIQYYQYYYYDLFLYNLKTNKQFQVTEKMRIKDPAWHPDPFAGKVVAVVNNAGTNNLVLFSFDDLDNLENKLFNNEYISFSDLTYLTDFRDGTQISQPVWSPQGDKIAFSLWHEGYQDIYIINIDEQDRIQSVNPITLDRHTDINPNWSADGQYLYFSSDRSNVFNLYAYSLKDEQLYRLTNVITGAFEPALSPDGKEMAFIQYHSSGYELHCVKVDHLLWKLIDNPQIDEPADFPVFKNNLLYFSEIKCNGSKGLDPLNTLDNLSEIYSDYIFKDYSPWESIMPTYWIPYAGIEGENIFLGFSTLAQDYLKYYSVPITIARNLFHDSFLYDLQFHNYRFKPVLSLSWQGETSSYSNLQLSLNFSDSGYTSKQDSGRFYSQNITVGVQNKYQLNYHNTENNSFNNGEDMSIINSLILRYVYNDTEKYPQSISPEIGNIFSLNYQYTLPYLNNEFQVHKILFDGRKYLPLHPKNHVLALRLVAGFVSDELHDGAKYNLGGNLSEQGLSTTNTTYFSLRGFPDSSFIGNHLFLTSLEYRFPLKMVEKKVGFRWASIFLEQVSGKLFCDTGHAWDKTIFPEQKDINMSIGAELDFVFKPRYTEQLILSLGIGKAITEPLPSRFYGRIGISF